MTRKQQAAKGKNTDQGTMLLIGVLLATILIGAVKIIFF